MWRNAIGIMGTRQRSIRIACGRDGGCGIERRAAGAGVRCNIEWRAQGEGGLHLHQSSSSSQRLLQEAVAPYFAHWLVS
jgi:hypothetical protein